MLLEKIFLPLPQKKQTSMKKIAFILTFLSLFFMPTKAQELNALLIELDRCVEQKEQYRTPRHHRIDSLKVMLRTTQGTKLSHVYEETRCFFYFSNIYYPNMIRVKSK